MTTVDVIRQLRDMAARSQGDERRLLDAAADLIEALDERVAIMLEGNDRGGTQC